MGEQRADMVSRSIIISLAIIALAHAVPRSADVVVPEDIELVEQGSHGFSDHDGYSTDEGSDHESHDEYSGDESGSGEVSPAQSSLLENIGKITKEADKLTHSTHGSSTQVDEQSNQIGALKKQLAHVKESFEQTAPNDGGAADLTSAKATAKDAITQAVTTMKTSVTDGFTTSKAAVVELEGAISTVERTIPTTELESIKVKSDEWCSSKTALDTAISEHTAAVIEFNNAAAPTLDPSLLAMSNFGPVTTCDLSVGESEACSTSWSCNLAQNVENAISAARTTYHTAIWDKKNKEDTKDTATETNTGKQSSFLTAIETTIAAEIAHCTGNDNIHASAVNAFNAVNTDRAAMYRQLTVVQCHVNHLDESDTSAVAVPEAATVGDTSTSAVDCVSKIKTKAQIKSSRFPDEALSGHASTCPTQTAYMNQIKAYGHPDMNLSDGWTPGATTCASVASHGGSSNAFSYVSNAAACSTECGQAGSEVVKYNCAKSDGTVVDTANCVGLTLPTDYTEACAATAACAACSLGDMTVAGLVGSSNKIKTMHMRFNEKEAREWGTVDTQYWHNNLGRTTYRTQTALWPEGCMEACCSVATCNGFGFYKGDCTLSTSATYDTLDNIPTHISRHGPWGQPGNSIAFFPMLRTTPAETPGASDSFTCETQGNAEFDNDKCLQDSSGFGTTDTCASSVDKCTSDSKDMHRCCSKACSVTAVCSLNVCNALAGAGDCSSLPLDCDVQVDGTTYNCLCETPFDISTKTPSCEIQKVCMDVPGLTVGSEVCYYGNEANTPDVCKELKAVNAQFCDNDGSTHCIRPQTLAEAKAIAQDQKEAQTTKVEQKKKLSIATLAGESNSEASIRAKLPAVVAELMQGTGELSQLLLSMQAKYRVQAMSTHQLEKIPVPKLLRYVERAIGHKEDSINGVGSDSVA